MIQEAAADELIPLITSVPSTNDIGSALEFIERQHTRLRTGAGYSFAIADLADAPVGQIGLWPTADKPDAASIGYWIRPTARNMGYASDALATLIVWARTLPHTRRLEIYVEPWNEGSWRVAEQSGFQREDLLRKWHPVGGVRRDMYRYTVNLR